MLKPAVNVSLFFAEDVLDDPNFRFISFSLQFDYLSGAEVARRQAPLAATVHTKSPPEDLVSGPKFAPDFALSRWVYSVQFGGRNLVGLQAFPRPDVAIDK
jgi:hypothetical protein